MSAQLSVHARPLDLTGRAIVLATDGSEASIAASRIALALETTRRAVIHVVHVIDTRAAAVPPPLDLMVGIADAAAGPTIHAEQEADVRATLAKALGTTVQWPVRIMLGTPAEAIVREARRVDAVLVVLGLRKHGRVDRVLHDETALNVMRAAPAAVLGVVAGSTGLPSHILAATDFSESSFIAARAAHSIAAERATMTLAYVSPLTAFLADDGERTIHDLGVDAAFAQTIRDLGVDGVTYDHVVIHRDEPANAADLLLEAADIANADLIAAGSARHGRLDRLMLGSVSADLVRDGRRSVLIVPPRGSRR